METLAVEKTAKESPLFIALDACDASMGSLTATLDGLEQRLIGVLRGAGSSPPTPEDSQQLHGPVVTRLMRQNDRLEILDTQVQSLLNRLDV